MAYRHDGLDAGLADVGDRMAKRDRLRAHRHAPQIGVEVDTGIDASVAGAQRGADFLPVVAVTPFDRVSGGDDQLPVALAQPRHFASSFNPSRMSRAVSAPSPALRLAAAMAAAACG